jgi:hypothetical protein
MGITSPEVRAPSRSGAPGSAGALKSSASDRPRRAGGKRSFDEGAAAGPHATEHDRRVRESIVDIDLGELSAAVARDVSRRGLSFGRPVARARFASTRSPA